IASASRHDVRVQYVLFASASTSAALFPSVDIACSTTATAAAKNSSKDCRSRKRRRVTTINAIVNSSVTPARQQTLGLPGNGVWRRSDNAVASIHAGDCARRPPTVSPLLGGGIVSGAARLISSADLQIRELERAEVALGRDEHAATVGCLVEVEVGVCAL